MSDSPADTNIYSNGSYLENNPTWHIEDSPWKAKQIIKILTNNNITPKTICEVGCGAGQILHQLYHNYSSEIIYSGFEVSPQAYELCQKINNDKIQFYLEDFCNAKNVFFDVILVIDIIEHIEDMFDFLRKVKDKGKYKIFHIPLDMFVLNIMKESNLSVGVNHLGHIHFFTKNVALEILRMVGYEIVDFFYTPQFQLPTKTLLSKMVYLPQKISYKLNNDLLIRTFGGVSLMVLTK